MTNTVNIDSLVPKTFSFSPVYVCNLVFDFCCCGRFSMAAPVTSLTTVTVTPVSTSYVIPIYKYPDTVWF